MVNSKEQHLFIFIFLDVTANMTTFALVELFMIWRSKL